jgi:beta-ureidopropionase / N-carbamoyl-L-amino-acid hydrolase
VSKPYGAGRNRHHTEGRVCLLAASDLDGEARRLFIRWCEAAGCIVRVNKIGNNFARRADRDRACRRS